MLPVLMYREMTRMVIGAIIVEDMANHHAIKKSIPKLKDGQPLRRIKNSCPEIEFKKFAPLNTTWEQMLM